MARKQKEPDPPTLWESMMEARRIARAQIMASISQDTNIALASLRRVAEHGEGPNGTGAVPACKTLLEVHGLIGQAATVAVETQDKDGNRTRVIVAPGKSEDHGGGV